MRDDREGKSLRFHISERRLRERIHSMAGFGSLVLDSPDDIKKTIEYEKGDIL